MIRIETTLGTFALELYENEAPVKMEPEAAREVQELFEELDEREAAAGRRHP